MSLRPLAPKDYIAIAKRRRWVLALPVIVLPIIGVGITFLLAPQYISQTLVLVEQQKVPDAYVKPVVSEDLDDRLATMKEQILSRSRIQPIIERFKLYPGMQMDSRLDLARKAITVKPIHSEISHSGGLPGFFISFKASDPHIAQVVCGEITSLFVDENLHDREQSAQGTTEFLKQQLADAKRDLDEQDSRLADFQRKYVGKLPGEESPNLNMLTSLNTQLEAATQQLARMQQDKSYQESMLAQQTHDPTTNEPLAVDPTAPPSPAQLELQSLQSQESDMASHYTAEYPDLVAIRQRIREAKARVAQTQAVATPKPGRPAPRVIESVSVQQLRAQIRASDQGIEAKKQEQAQLQNAVRLYQDRIQATPLVEQEYKSVTRDYETAQKFYDDLLAKMNQSKMATDLEHRQQGEQFKVMDEPNLPDAPSFPNRVYFAMGGLFLGLALGTGIAAVQELKDTSLRTEEDLWFYTKLPTLAVISQLDASSLKAASQKTPRSWKTRFGLSGARG